MEFKSRPPHLFLDDTVYFLTASIYQKRKLLATPAHRQIFLQALLEICSLFNVRVKAWVILCDHYHLLFKINDGRQLSKFMQRLHGRTAFELNGLDGQRGRPVWYNYWDRCIRNEAGYWTRFNYIHYNPIKHGYTKRMRDWEFSSIHHYEAEMELAWLADVWRAYPVRQVNFDHDDF